MLRSINIDNLKELELGNANVYLDRRLKIATVNVRSVKSKALEIQLKILNHSLDIVLVTESWLKH